SLSLRTPILPSCFKIVLLPRISTLPLHDALPIFNRRDARGPTLQQAIGEAAGRCSEIEAVLSARIDGEGLERSRELNTAARHVRSEEHTSELQSPYDLVCRLLLELKKCGGCSQAE